MTEKSEQSEEHWSYMGETSPEHWAEIEKSSNCDGFQQSPINILEEDVVRNGDSSLGLNIFYSPRTKIKAVENNGHSIQFDFEAGDSIEWQGLIYELVQLHFHEPSEHTLNGLRYPIETHFVHVNEKAGFTVISVLGIEGKKSQCFEFFNHFLPIAKGEFREIEISHDLTSLFPDNKEFFYYKGSLTTPPCSENVEWIIFKNPIQLSVDEVLAFRENMPLENYRNEQSLNDRQVFLHSF